MLPVPPSVPFGLPFRPGAEAGEPGESENQAANRRAAAGPLAREVIESRSIHALLHSLAMRRLSPPQCGE
jgi:hypothetical protein